MILKKSIFNHNTKIKFKNIQYKKSLKKTNNYFGLNFVF